MTKRGRPKKDFIDAETALISTASKRDIIKRAFAEALWLPEVPDLDEWADRHRVLTRESSHEFGPWRTARFPFLRTIMKCLSVSSRCREIIIMKGAQLGFTEVAINWILYKAMCNPGPMLYLQKTDEAAMAFSDEKLKPAIKECLALENILGANKPTGYANRSGMRAYPGGYIKIGGANTSSFLKSSAIGDATADEEDEYELDVGKQGSPILMLQKRMMNFPGSKTLRVSTPVLREQSTIEPAFLSGSQERYYLPCPQCNPKADYSDFMFYIVWDQIKYSDELDPMTDYPLRTWLECPRCGGEIDEAQHKMWMLDHGEWFSERTGKRELVGDLERRSFQIPSFYSPPGFYSWTKAVQEWHDWLRTRDREKHKVFVNQVCAETYYLQGSEISSTGLEARREDYASSRGHFDVPAGGLCLTAGVDIQKDRIEAEVVAWGLLDESWSVDYEVFPGDPELLGNAHGMLPDGRPSVWRLLDEYLYRKWKHESGTELPIECVMVDAGDKTDKVHTFCRYREGRRVFPLRGESGWGKGTFKVSRRRHEKYGTILYHAYTDELKATLYSLLQVGEPGPGFCHFPKKEKYGKKYFSGLTCETRKVKMVKGRQVLYWDTPSGARNEPIDCRNYARVAFLAYPVDLAARAKEGVGATFRAPIKRRARAIAHPGL